MASSSGTLLLLSPGFENSGTHTIRGSRYTMNSDANGIVDGVEDGGSGWNHSLLADALGAERPDGSGILDQDRFDGRHVAGGGNQVVVQILTLAGKEFFHERLP